METYVALIVDIVGSRRLSDRSAVQRDILDAFARAHEVWEPERPLYATVGDEFQAVFTGIGDAMLTATAAALHLDSAVSLRCGLGRGHIKDVDGVMDGSAWWHAREAIESAHREQHAGQPDVLSCFVDPEGGDAAAVRATLRLRDHVVARMKARERRIAASLLLGVPQTEIAAAESISQSAVSQNVHRSGARALREALMEVQEVRR